MVGDDLELSIEVVIARVGVERELDRFTVAIDIVERGLNRSLSRRTRRGLLSELWTWALPLGKGSRAARVCCAAALRTLVT